MTELALELWPLVAADSPTGVRGWTEERRLAKGTKGRKDKRRPAPPFRDPALTAELEGAILSAPKDADVVPRDADVWKQGTEQARLELLVDVLYRNPGLARTAMLKLRSALGYEGPRFLQDLARLAIKDAGKDRASPGPIRSEQEWVDWLIGSPDTVVALADKFRVALPFTLVLHRELQEIAASRARRLALDTDAEIIRLKRELEYADRTLSWHRQTRGQRRSTPVQSVKPSDLPGSDQPDQESAGPASDSLDDELSFVAEYVGKTLDKLLAQQRTDIVEAAAPPDSPPPPAAPAAGAGGAGPAVPPSGPVRHPLRVAQAQDLVGLALSGGGIRSATFNLGVLQALADLDLLRRVDYISSVSGGGYIASWLAAWSKRCVPGGIRTVQRCLSPARAPDPQAEGLRPIRWLREFSNYLTPKIGFLSADTWTMIMCWLRNTLLNQTVLVLLFAAVLLIPRGLAPLAFFAVPTMAALYLAAALLACSSIFIGLNLRRFDRAIVPGPTARFDFSSQGMVQKTIVGPAFVAAFLLTKPLLEDAVHEHWLWVWAGLAVCLFLIQVFSRSDRCFYPEGGEPSWGQLAVAWAAILAMSVVSAGAGAVVLRLFARGFHGWAENDWKDGGAWHAITFGPPLLTLSLSLITTTQIGLLGRNLPDERREWWSRLGAWSLIYTLGWLALCATSIYGPWGLAKLGVWLSAAALGWVAATTGGVLAAKSTKETGAAPTLKLPKGIRVRRILAVAGPYVFIVGLFVAIAFGLHRLILRLDPVANVSQLPSLAQLADGYWTYTVAGRYVRPLALLVIAGAASALLAWRVDVNEFSMHHFYKNRLVRCYLGASRPPGSRHANRFTGFDRSDDVDLATLRVGADPPYVGPYPLINTALNLVKGENLAWQERKASSFVFTPWYSGYEYLPVSAEVAESPNMSANGYRLTDEFAYSNKGGIALGTAAAISGAAANPNMGYHSSPAATFLLTVFNARLGWWLGNPRDESSWRKSSPDTGLLYHFNELAGNTNDRSKFVNLSDGGHFENLGVYELVRRRCGYIIACDSEQDAAVDFGGLGNLIRKCRVDFGVNIVMAPDRIRIHGEDGRSQVHCVVGTVTYPDNRSGKLLYIKASLTGDEPADVIEYQRRQSAFPHQTTGDQWFDESQFESYRVLGHHSATTALRQAAEALTSVDPQAGCVLPGPLFQYLESLWYPPSMAIESHFTQHTASYDTLLDRIRAQAKLSGLDRILFQDATGVMAGAAPPLSRDMFYILVTMISLMQDVFLDLDLENNSSHPHNAGWVRVFHRWASATEFREAWQVTKETYGERFRRFCETELNLAP